MISGSYLIDWVDLDHPDAHVFTRIATNSIRAAHKYAARACPDGFRTNAVYAE